MNTFKTDTAKTGKLYPKLDALIKNPMGEYEYFGSSCQFRTQKGFKEYLLNCIEAPLDKYIKIVKGEE